MCVCECVYTHTHTHTHTHRWGSYLTDRMYTHTHIHTHTHTHTGGVRIWRAASRVGCHASSLPTTQGVFFSLSFFPVFFVFFSPASRVGWHDSWPPISQRCPLCLLFLFFCCLFPPKKPSGCHAPLHPSTQKVFFFSFFFFLFPASPVRFCCLYA